MRVNPMAEVWYTRLVGLHLVVFAMYGFCWFLKKSVRKVNLNAILTKQNFATNKVDIYIYISITLALLPICNFQIIPLI